MSKDESKVRGDSDYYKKLAEKSARARIKRNIDVEFVLDKSRVTKVPSRTRPTDAGFDIAACSHVVIADGERISIPTGIRVKSPAGYFYRIENRSSMMKQGLFLTPSIVDATYTGELFVTLLNCSGHNRVIEVGDRVAQIVFYPQINASFKELEQFENTPADRGEAGFGSTGK